MGRVNDIVGTVGGVILVLELLVLLVLLIGINAGLVFGLRWVHGKTGFVHEKRQLAQTWLVRYVDRGSTALATPVIVSTSLWRGLKVGLHRATHWPTNSLNVPAALPARPRPAGEHPLPAAESPRVA
jgi:uncharacterized membrane protein YedE/YeeE